MVIYCMPGTLTLLRHWFICYGLLKKLIIHCKHYTLQTPLQIDKPEYTHGLHQMCFQTLWTHSFTAKMQRCDLNKITLWKIFRILKPVFSKHCPLKSCTNPLAVFIRFQFACGYVCSLSCATYFGDRLVCICYTVVKENYIFILRLSGMFVSIIFCLNNIQFWLTFLSFHFFTLLFMESDVYDISAKQ